MILNPVKSATNMAILQFLIHNGARTREITANKLAHVFWFILAQHKSEMADSTNQYFAIMRTLRNLLREITKVAKGPRILNHKIWFKFLIFFFVLVRFFEIRGKGFYSHFFMVFSKTLMEEARPPFSDTAENRKLMLEGLVDLLTLTMLLRTTPLRDSTHKTAQNVGQSAAAKASDELDEQIKQFKLDMPIMHRMRCNGSRAR